jgi:hypothetical protein
VGGDRLLHPAVNPCESALDPWLTFFSNVSFRLGESVRVRESLLSPLRIWPAETSNSPSAAGLVILPALSRMNLFVFSAFSRGNPFLHFTLLILN